MGLEDKTARLRSILQAMEGVVVGYSGGVDSTLLAKMAHDVLGDRVLAVIADSESMMPSELAEAVGLVESLGVPCRVIRTCELDNPNYARNPSDRCFYCKDELFSQLTQLAAQQGLKCVADGANVDDAGDHRPGHRAAAAHGVRHPLQEAGFAKADIRALAKQLGLPNWDKPAMACLASRFPYGTEISAQKLAMVAAAEETMKANGFRGFRVRHHESGADFIARIEVSEVDFARVLDPAVRREVEAQIRSAGYHYVTLDLQPFRSGRLNEAIQRRPKG